ncbi:MAG TPA: TOBE domain-containing protein [Candidatus Angelobacter sp.]|jgi:molybdopterin-binding protein|nr:TOBE domain-containing protein [Candidatus Angelobacter sp.]
MQTSARNRLPGVVRDVRIEGLMARVDIQVGDNHVVALISAEAATDLQLQVGMRVSALVKATSVMVVRDEDGQNAD